MLKGAVRLVQEHLKKEGRYNAAIDGDAGPITHEAVLKELTERKAELTASPLQFSPKRRLIMMLQLMAKDAKIEVGPIDGYWGPMTLHAYESLAHLKKHGELPPNWRDDQPSDANPNKWPRQRQADLQRFFGKPCKVPLVMVDCPWTLRLAWNLSAKTRSIRIHKKVAPSLERILKKVHKHYGTAELKRLRLDLYGGSYVCRSMRGGSSWSTHAYGIAIDWDPSRNQLRWGRDKASLDHPNYDYWWKAWEAEGWVSLGRSRNFDWMHVQAARL